MEVENSCLQAFITGYFDFKKEDLFIHFLKSSPDFIRQNCFKRSQTDSEKQIELIQIIKNCNLGPHSLPYFREAKIEFNQKVELEDGLWSPLWLELCRQQGISKAFLAAVLREQDEKELASNLKGEDWLQGIPPISSLLVVDVLSEKGILPENGERGWVDGIFSEEKFVFDPSQMEMLSKKFWKAFEKSKLPNKDSYLQNVFRGILENPKSVVNVSFSGDSCWDLFRAAQKRQEFSWLEVFKREGSFESFKKDYGIEPELLEMIEIKMEKEKLLKAVIPEGDKPSKKKPLTI